MWLYTDIGFFSIVQKDGAGTLTIRSRVRKDLEKLRAWLIINDESAPIVTSYDSDYRYRIIVPKDLAAEVVCQLVKSITYDNFKDRISSNDKLRAQIYSKIWVETSDLELLDEE